MAAFEDSSDYLVQEFEAMDMDEDGLLTSREIFQILIYQGVELSENEMQKELRRAGPLVNKSEFVAFMQSLNSSTRKLREVFALFSKDGEWCSDRTDILKGLKDLGIDDAAKIVSCMESNKHRITYGSFLRDYFRAKGNDLN